MDENALYLLAPPAAFAVFLLIGWLLYKWSESIAPKLDATREKLLTYACGLDVPEGAPRPNYELFYVAFIFTIFHIAALMALTLSEVEPGSPGPSILGMFYLMAVLAGVYAVVSR